MRWIRAKYAGKHRLGMNETPPSLLRPGVEVRLQRGRLHRRIQRRRDTLPLPRQQHPDPMDPGTSSRHQRLTSGQDTWSARCAERRTPGAGGDLRETDWWQHRHRARGSTSPRMRLRLILSMRTIGNEVDGGSFAQVKSDIRSGMRSASFWLRRHVWPVDCFPNRT